MSRGLGDVYKRQDGGDALPMLMNQIYRPREAEGLLKTMDYVNTLIENIPMYQMGCNMKKDAARVAYEGMK